MKNLALLLVLIVTSIGHAQNNFPIYDNVRYAADFKIVSSNDFTFVASPFARPELSVEERTLQNRPIKKITYLYSYNNKHPEFAQNRLSDNRYRNLMKVLHNYDLTNVEWETVAQAGCGEIPCSEKLYHGFLIEYVTPKHLLGRHQLKSQNHKLNSEVKSTIVGEDGTKVEIPANAFVDAFGNAVKGEIDVTLIEAVTTEAIVLGGLFTVTKEGAVLESKGMIQIQASQGDSEIQLNGTSELTVELPTTYEEGFQYFQGETVNGNIVWDHPVPMENGKADKGHEFNLDEDDYLGKREGNKDFLFDMVESREMMDFFPLRANYVKSDLIGVVIMNFGKTIRVSESTANKKDLKKKGLDESQIEMVTDWFEADTVIHEKLQWSVEDNNVISNSNSNGRFDEGSLTNNIFKMKKTGWANCDKFSGAKESEMMATNLTFEGQEEYYNMQVSVVLPNSNVLVNSFQKSDGSFFLAPLPIGKKAIVIAYGKKDGDHYFDLKEFKIGDSTAGMLTPAIMEEDDAMKIIKKAI